MQKYTEINRLKKLNHLGVIHNVFPGIRHTRWDYTITMLYLIQQLRETNIEGLSSDKRMGEIRITGRDMMQLLALSANIGHLPGTFSVEKGLMRFLLHNNEFKDKIIKIINISEEEFIKIDYTNLNKMFEVVPFIRQ